MQKGRLVIKGKIIRKIANQFWVKTQNDTFLSSPRGNLKKDSVFVGDNVFINRLNTGENIIEKVCERKNCLVRPPLANIDKLFIVVSIKPKPDFMIVDKLILFALVYNIEPILVLNKSDLNINDLSTYILKTYSNVCKILCVSALNGYNINELKCEFDGSVCAFAGQSAVGKSSLVNALFCEDLMEIGSFSKKIDRGTHTTRHCELFSINDTSFIADTPGFTFLDEKLLPIKFDELSSFYPDFIPFITGCKFSNSCSHISEKLEKCGIKNAVKLGLIDKMRYERYSQIYDSLKKRWLYDYK